ncbi:hypothetical protein EW146_g7864 [Bondarzewia mesenterica]|uniref:F-box domain-containing protein n=1 Tax=Bondarzewia mesenterica TaxID=1095465 RepID=A0A4S4LIU1_9AGAM|nr:hypothetical protein EW146_g7864 [Bondarzewia mesenterica]
MPAANTVNLWLSRSTLLPFRLSLFFDDGEVPVDWDSNVVTPHDCFRRIEGLTSRLADCSISLSKGRWFCVPEQLPLLAEDTPRLESLSITVYPTEFRTDDYRDYSPYVWKPLFSSMPSLKSFTLRTDACLAVSTFDFPWALTKLNISRNSVKTPITVKWSHYIWVHDYWILHILRSCPLLEECTVFTHTSSHRLTADTVPVHLTHLHTLHLQIDALRTDLFVLGVDLNLFRALCLPALTDLRISCPPGSLRGMLWSTTQFLHHARAVQTPSPEARPRACTLYRGPAA